MLKTKRTSSQRFKGIIYCFLALWVFTYADRTQADPNPSKGPSFRNDVLPVLSKQGCNGGGCHGALAGKGGFRLSLFGYDPVADHKSITREARGRRIELADPGRSLILTKPTTSLPHKGGLRLDPSSPDYHIIANWIAAGAPAPTENDAKLVNLEIIPKALTLTKGQQKQLKVEATYSDGMKRDVTRWVRFSSTVATVCEVSSEGKITVIGPGEGAVTAWFSSKIVISRITSPYPNKVSQKVFVEQARENFIDELVLEQLQRLKLPPSPQADDATFIRRAYIDTIGRLPTPEEVRKFIADSSKTKFKELTEHLLSREEFVDYWTYKFSDIFLVTGSKLRPDAVKAYYHWIRSKVQSNTPWDTFVSEVVTAKGSSVTEGATNFYAVHQDPESMAENVSQAFLSLSINCAKCHNHPLEKWTNDQYYAFANLFSRVRAKGWGGDARNGNGHRTLYVEPRGELIQPRTGKPQAPAPLDAPSLNPDDEQDRRDVLAKWLTSPENPYFSRAITNRIWANFMGLGLVEPIDDLRVSNPATNEKLLSKLSQYLVEKKFDLKELMRVILNSRTYRRSSQSLKENEADKRNYAYFQPRRLMAEVLADAISDITQVRETYDRVANKDGSTSGTKFYPKGTRAIELFDSAVKSSFLKTFGRNPREITCECERSNQPSLVQALHLSNGSTINDKLAHKENRVSALFGKNINTEKIVEEVWLLCLSRLPSDTEKKRMVQEIEASPKDQRRLVIEDVFWSVMTSREFLFQH